MIVTPALVIGAVVGLSLILTSSSARWRRAGTGMLICLVVALVVANPIGIGTVIVRGVNALIG